MNNNKTVWRVLLVLVLGALWMAMASINAGLLGFGAVLSVAALMDVVGGEFTAGNKVVWLVIALAALLFAVIGIGAKMVFPPSEEGNPVWMLTTVICLVLPVLYFVIGRRQKRTSEK
ncbi:MAG: hypothetical protein GX751_02145 [Desulfuromonadaceae bacterium]|jgi:hypothetical protein|nr:hypothetical protein [Desulfuromonadaceae bacterium]